MKWYVQPWRLFTLYLGTATLYYGAGQAPDWDVGISLLMAATTYLLMPLFDQWIRQPRTWLPAFLAGDFAVNGVYSLYWGWKDPAALHMIWANYPASWALFLMCWVVWSLVPEGLDALTKTTISFRHFIQRRRGSGA